MNSISNNYKELLKEDSIEKILKIAFYSDIISFQKFRQMCIISGAGPSVFFDITNNRTAIVIKDKKKIYSNMIGQDTANHILKFLNPNFKNFNLYEVQSVNKKYSKKRRGGFDLGTLFFSTLAKNIKNQTQTVINEIDAISKKRVKELKDLKNQTMSEVKELKGNILEGLYIGVIIFFIIYVVLYIYI